MASVRIHQNSAPAFPLDFFSFLFFSDWCHFCPSGVMPSDPDTVFRNGAQVSHRYPSFSPAYCFGDAHASIPDHVFLLSCWQPLMILVIKKVQCQPTQFFSLSYFLDEYISFSVRLIKMWSRHSCPATCFPSTSSPPSQSRLLPGEANTWCSAVYINPSTH